MSERYAVFGHPIGHSLSPRIHGLFARQTGQDMSYEAIDPGRNGFHAGARRFAAAHGRGFNVTVPFKTQAYELVDHHDEHARQARAVNTVRREADQRLSGFNTDGLGLVRDLTQNLGFPVCGKRVLIVGAGGAAAGIVGPLLAQNPRRLVLANRTAERAQTLADRFVSDAPDSSVLAAAPLDTTEDGFDLVINATSAGLAGQLLALADAILAPGALAYDLMYSEKPTAFLRWAAQAGAGQTRDGKGMLVEQAAEAFLLWRGVRPETAPVIRALRASGD